MAKLQTNTLYYGDNLEVLRDHIPDESVDLIYLDPPFNSNRNYNVLFKEPTAKGESPAQIQAFEDTWHPGESANRAFAEVALRGSDDTGKLLKAMVDALGHNDVTAYLSMMAVRLIELQRVLKSTGSLYLHCDPTASHYLKVLMDSVFGPTNFRNEIIWKRATTVKSNFGQGSKLWGQATDTLLFYSKSKNYTFHQDFKDYDDSYVESSYRNIEKSSGRRYTLVSMTGPGGAAKGNPEYEVLGVKRYWRYSKEKMQELIDHGLVVQSRPGVVPRRKYYLDEGKGVAIQSLWDDIPALHSLDSRRLGYPTQKPIELLERIIRTSTDPGDVVLDPFCGCGTAVHAAQNLGRNWIGIDITNLAINLIRRRMEDAFPQLKDKITVVGEPVDLPGAEQLAEKDKYQFQWWALDRIGASPAGGDKKKGMDRGIDGVIPFLESSSDRQRVIVSVKGGSITSGMVRDLVGVVKREGAAIGVFLTLRPPTREMKTEAAAAGMYTSERWAKSYPRLQIITVAEVLNGKKVDMPPQVSPFAEAPREKVSGKQAALEL